VHTATMCTNTRDTCACRGEGSSLRHTSRGFAARAGQQQVRTPSPATWQAARSTITRLSGPAPLLHCCSNQQHATRLHACRHPCVNRPFVHTSAALEQFGSSMWPVSVCPPLEALLCSYYHIQSGTHHTRSAVHKGWPLDARSQCKKDGGLCMFGSQV
jgi:hypothetical protein